MAYALFLWQLSKQIEHKTHIFVYKITSICHMQVIPQMKGIDPHCYVWDVLCKKYHLHISNLHKCQNIVRIMLYFSFGYCSSYLICHTWWLKSDLIHSCWEICQSAYEFLITLNGCYMCGIYPAPWEAGDTGCHIAQ